ncbi:TPA: hypothetical protein ACGOVD_001762 [Streptococcus suis]
MGVSLGLTYSLHQEIKQHPEKSLSDILMWGVRSSKIMVVAILLLPILFSFIPDLNWHRGLAIFLGMGYGLLWKLV